MPGVVRSGTVSFIGIPIGQYPTITGKPLQLHRMQPVLRCLQGYLRIPDPFFEVACPNPIHTALVPEMQTCEPVSGAVLWNGYTRTEDRAQKL